MGKNRLVYGENTEISYLSQIMKGMMAVCGAIGILLIVLGQIAFGCIGLAAVVIIAIVVISENRKQYQKVDGSFCYEGKTVSIHIDIYGKMRKKKPVIIHYGDKEISLQSSEGGKYAKSLNFMLEEDKTCVFYIDRKKKGVTVKIGEETIVDNNYVRKEYLLPD